MAHIKVVPCGSQPSLTSEGEHTNQLIKMGSNGLRGFDLRALEKRAGYSFANALRSFELKPGDVPVHNISLGATEFYGPNRNGDGFKEATCKKQHETFVKYARWYRHHQNKDPKKSYGIIKASFYNPEMHRIELLCILNGTKEAADRNGGLVANDELDLLNSGKDIPTSMACKVAYDVCAGCGNQARNRSEYCTGEDEGGHCKRGGCKNRLTMAHDDGFINHVENPFASFFDMSRVFRGADRTSYAFGGVKAASGRTMGGSELAESLGLTTAPQLAFHNLDWPTNIEKLAASLTLIENEYREFHKQASCDAAFALNEATTWNDHGADDPRQALAALSLYKIAMPIEAFVSFYERGEDAGTVKLAKQLLPDAFGWLLEQGHVTYENLKPYLPVGVAPQGVMKWAADRAEGYSLEDRFLERRAQLAAMYNLPVPSLNQPLTVKVAGQAESLARDYLLYKLAFLHSLATRNQSSDLTNRLVVRQNYLQ